MDTIKIGLFGLGVVGRGGGTHTRDEWVDTADLARGAEYALRIVLGSFAG